MVDLSQVIARARSTERRQRHAAFGELVERFKDAAYAWAVGAGCDPHLAQDMAQEAFLAAYLRLGELREPAAFPGWLKQIVRRKCARQLAARDRARSTRPEPEAAAGDHLAALEEDERWSALREAVAGLSLHERAAAELHYLEGLSQQQVADRLGLTTAAVKKRMQRARQHLRERMSAMSPDLFEEEMPSLDPQFSRELLEMLEATEPRQAFEARTEEDGRALLPLVARIEAHRRRLTGLGDADLKVRSAELNAGAATAPAVPSLDRLLPEAYALAIECFARTASPGTSNWDQGRLLEAALLHHGKAVAVADWEGRVEVAALPLYLNSLGGRPVHFVAIGEDEAERAHAQFEPAGALLGCTAVVGREGAPAEGEVLFSPVHKVGFDYLRETATRLSFAVVDHAERLLIDEGPTPMAVSRQVEDWRPDLFRLALPAARELVAAQRDGGAGALFEVAGYGVRLLPEGLAFATERLPELKSEADSQDRLTNVLTQMLRSLSTHRRGRDYEVIDGRVVVLSSSGEPQPTRRFSEGLHQALETKEGVEIQPEREILASITIRELFRRFERLAGLVPATDMEPRVVLPTRPVDHL